MKISRTSAIAIFVALGFKTADKWDDDRFNKRLSQMADNVDDDAIKGIEDEGTRKELKGILKALENSETVEIEAEAKKKPAAESDETETPKAKTKAPAEDDETETPAPKKKDAGKVAEEKVKSSTKKTEDADEPEAPKKKKVVAKSTKEEPAKDKYGNREGSQAANINAQLAKKWTPVADVAKATTLSEARVRSHFKYLEGRKLAEYDAEKGARLV